MPRNLILGVVALFFLLVLGCSQTTPTSPPATDTPSTSTTVPQESPTPTPASDEPPSAPGVTSEPPPPTTEAAAPPTSEPAQVQTPMPVAQVQLSSQSLSVIEGKTGQIEAVTRDSAGNELTDRRIAWSSSDPGVAQVSPRGLVVGASVGRTTVTATSEGVSASAEVVVEFGPVESIDLALINGNQLVATPRDARGNQLTGRQVSWSTSNPSVVDVDPDTGSVTAGSTGVATITATVESVSVDATITVSPEPVAAVAVAPGSVTLEIGEDFQLAATPRSNEGDLLTGRTVQWSSSNEDVALVSSNGLVSGRSEGTATITVAVDNAVATVTVTVNPPPVDYALFFSSSPDRSDPQLLNGATTFEDLHIFTSPDDRVSSVTFFVGNPNGGQSTIKTESLPPYDMLGTREDGTAQTLDSGQVTPNSYAIIAEITQTNGNTVEVNATFTVTPVPVGSVEIDLDSVTIEEDETVQLSAIALDADGQPLTNREVTWSSENPDVADVSLDGVVKAVAEGVTILTAEADGVTATLPISVTRKQVTFELLVSTNIESEETARDLDNIQALNNSELFGPIIVFVSPEESIDQVSYNVDGEELGDFPAGGVVSGLGASFITEFSPDGNVPTSHSLVATITSTDGEVHTLGAVFTAIPVPVDTVEIVMQPFNSDVISLGLNEARAFPPPDLLPVGLSASLFVIATDVQGNSVTDRVVSWSSSDDSIASFDLISASNGSLGYTFYGRYSGQNSSNGFSAAPRVDEFFQINNAVPNATLRGHLVGTVTVTASIDGVEGTADLDVFFPLESISAGFNHSCGLTADGKALCWGSGVVGQLGNGATDPQNQPVHVLGNLTFESLSVGANRTCGVATGGAGYCWGGGGLGNGTTNSSTVPVPISGGLTFASISVGSVHNCGVTTSGDGYCWGFNSSGQLGDGTTDRRNAPAEVAGNLTFESISPADTHTCGVTTDGDAYCWGFNANAELGDGTEDNSAVPVPVAGGLTFASLDTAENHSCGVTTDEQGYCWGFRANGRLGVDTDQNHAGPVAVSGGLSFVSVSAGESHTCGVTTDSLAYCWGKGDHGRLGNGTTTDLSEPTPVDAEHQFASVSAGEVHTCGVTTDNQPLCWGFGGLGRLGSDSSGNPTPIAVSAPEQVIPE